MPVRLRHSSERVRRCMNDEDAQEAARRSTVASMPKDHPEPGFVWVWSWDFPAPLVGDAGWVEFHPQTGEQRRSWPVLIA